MPTLEEIDELSDECYWDGGYLNGVEGDFVIGPNGNSIFIPFAGYRDGTYLDHEGLDVCCWSGTLSDYYGAYYLGCCWGDGGWNSGWGRGGGLTVRPVSD